jgi:hypothetical protein
MDWRKRELDKLLREEFEKRGFYLVGSGPVEWAPMINYFKSHAAVEKYLKLEAMDYKYVAYKNLGATVGFDGNTKQDVITACLFVKIGSCKREINPIADLAMFYRGRLYKCTCECRHFFFEIGYVRSSDELKDMTKEIWECTERVVFQWQHTVRTLIIENRWPEGNYISDIKFLED